MNTESLTTENDICPIVRANIDDFGTFYDEPHTKPRLDDYFTATGNDPHDPKLIFGQLLGLNTLKSFIAKIDDYNNSAEPGESIAGVRVYNAMSRRPFLPSPDDQKLLPDIIVLPVFENGDDFYKIVMLTDPAMALSNAMPCPNQCGTSFYIA